MKLSRLLIATGNAGKLREYREMFAEMPFNVCGLDEFPDAFEPDETGATFEQNAAIKARSYAEQTAMWVLADDSGLEITALGGAPGVQSARFAGRETSFAQKMSVVLDLMKNSVESERAARFVCVIALARPDGEIEFTATGVCEGTIAESHRGSGGFGYDPIFVPEGFDRTFGELPDGVKREISHRGRAASIIIRYLLDFIASLT